MSGRSRGTEGLLGLCLGGVGVLRATVSVSGRSRGAEGLLGLCLGGVGVLRGYWVCVWEE